MEPEASLQLLHLSKEASVDDVHRAYSELHREISHFHRESDEDSQGDFQKDVELLTCAYECAVSYLSEKRRPKASIDDPVPAGDSSPTIDFPTNRPLGDGRWDRLPDELVTSQQADQRTVEEAIVITSRKLRETESALPDAQDAVTVAKQAVEKARQRAETAKQANLNTMISAKSAKIRALLLDVEAKKAEKKAKVVAEKARARAEAARQAAEEARHKADQVKQQVIRAKRSEEAATAEVICAEDRMEKEAARLKSLEQKLLETQNCMRMFQETTTDAGTFTWQAAAPLQKEKGLSVNSDESPQPGEKGAHERILSELQNIQVFAEIENRQAKPEPVEPPAPKPIDKKKNERRHYPRIVYPMNQHPTLTVEDKSIAVLDLCTKGIRLDASHEMDQQVVRGSIEFPDQGEVPIAGRVIRSDAEGIGIKLVTRISNRVLEKERLRLAG